MFAPKVAKPQTKAAATLISNLAHQRAALAAHRLGYSSADQALLLQRTIGNQATLRFLTDRPSNSTATEIGQHGPEASQAAREAPRASYDFSRISVFSPERANPSPPSFLQSSSQETSATAKAIHQATVENGTAAPVTPAALYAAMTQVRMRDDVSADRSARLLRAEALAFGNQVLFRRGRYEPQTERGRALMAHELTHVAHQSQTGHSRPQRLVGGDVLSVQFTENMAKAMTDDELRQQMKLLRSHLQSESQPEPGAAANLSVLESVAYSRQGSAGITAAPTVAPPSAPVSATTTREESTLVPGGTPLGLGGATEFPQPDAGGNEPITSMMMTEAEYEAMTGMSASSLPKWVSGVPVSIGTGSLFTPQPNWYYRALQPTDPSLSEILGGKDLLPVPPRGGGAFQPADSPAEMTFRQLRRGGDKPMKGSDRISTAGDLEPFETILKDRVKGEFARVDVHAARRLGAEFLEHGQIMQQLEQLERDLLAQLDAARAAGRGKNFTAKLEKRLGYIREARKYAIDFTEGQGVGRIPSGAISKVRGSTLARAIAGERAFLLGLKFFRYGGRVMLVVGAGMSVDRVASAPSDQRGRVAAQEAGGWAFSLPGAAVGAKLGAAGGAALGFETGPGAIVAAAIGSLIGAAVGFAGGEQAAEQLYDIGDSGLKLLGDTPRLIETMTLMFGSDQDRRRYYELREIEAEVF